MKLLFLAGIVVCCLSQSCSKKPDDSIPKLPMLTIISPASLEAKVWYKSLLDISFKATDADSVVVDGVRVFDTHILLSNLTASRSLLIQAFGKGGFAQKRVAITIYSEKATWLANPLGSYFRMTENVDSIVGQQGWFTHTPRCDDYSYGADNTFITTIRMCNSSDAPIISNSEWHFTANGDSIRYGHNYDNMWKIEYIDQNKLVLSKTELALFSTVLVHLRQTFKKQ